MTSRNSKIAAGGTSQLGDLVSHSHTFILSERFSEKLALWAKAAEVPKAEIIRRAVREFLDKHPASEFYVDALPRTVPRIHAAKTSTAPWTSPRNSQQKMGMPRSLINHAEAMD
jgi:hypothetical protein